MICVLSGGVGAARLLATLQRADSGEPLTAIVNVGDDLEMHGLTICPDLDTITYTLAGQNNDETGWGLRGETWRVMSELSELGGEAWFALGDRDLATHLYRTQRLRAGARKTDVARELARHFALSVELLPVTDDPVATVFDTDQGELSFQEYFVRHRHDVAVRAVRFAGAAEARATDEVRRALREARRIVIAPSNPLISIEPLLSVGDVRRLVRERRDDVVAVSPLVGGAALKGPADRLLGELGYDVSCLGVADVYGDLVGTWVIDVADADAADALAQRGHRVIVTTTVMADPENGQRLARAVSA